MKKLFACIASLMMVVGAIVLIAPQAMAEASDTPEWEYYPYFDECRCTGGGIYWDSWCDPRQADMYIYASQGWATCTGTTFMLPPPTFTDTVAVRIHLDAFASGFYNDVEIVYVWDGGEDVENINLPHSEFFVTTITFIEPAAPPHFQEIRVTVTSGGLCSAKVAVDVEWFYMGIGEPYPELPPTPPYYPYFDYCKSKTQGYAFAEVNQEYADMYLSTFVDGGVASARGETKMLTDVGTCIGVKVHIIGKGSVGPHDTLTVTYSWDGQAVTEYWFDIPEIVDITWTYTTEVFIAPAFQSIEFELFGPVCSPDVDLFIDVEWFYLGEGPPSWPPI